MISNPPPRDSLLVSAGELVRLLREDNPPTILDVRWRVGAGALREDYLAGHIPGAVFVDLDTDLAAPAGDGSHGRHPLPDAKELEATMRRAGLCEGHPVVVYDERDSTSAARAWWVLRWAGHAQTRVLDGGLRAWIDNGQPLEKGESAAVTRGDFTARSGSRPTIDAAAAGRFPLEGVLLDARAGERYRGELEPIDPAAGHIPGATSAPTARNVDQEGVFLDGADLRRRFEALGASDERPVATYCGSGVTAAHGILALELAGYEGPALYPGSWSERVSDPSRPVATGPAPGRPAAAPRPAELPAVVAGKVVRGDQRGRDLGFPTANLDLGEIAHLPLDGIYAGWLKRPDGTRHTAAISVGRRPTFYGDGGVVLVEAYLLDFEGDLYGEEVEVGMETRVRGQERFASVEALIERMGEDVEEVRRRARERSEGVPG